MRYRLGRFLQLVGLLIAPQGIVLNLMEKVTLPQSLFIAGAGCAVFYIGRAVQEPTA
jgi:hypothetical protein